MKKIFYLASVLLLMTSCDKYLEVKTYGKAIPKTSEEFASILHRHLNSIDYGEDHVLMDNSSSILSMESVTDNYNSSLTFPGGNTLPTYLGSLLNNKQQRYERLYEVIRDANIIINNLPTVATAEEKNVMGTAYAFRAIAYYHLLREFCEPFVDDGQLGVPYVIDFDMEERPLRSSYGRIKALIESDFEKSLSFSVDAEIYRYTQDVVKAYQAKYFFWTKQWTPCIEVSQYLLAKYPLVKGEAYVNMIQAKNSKEGSVIFRSYLFSGSQDINFINNQGAIKNRPLSKDLIEAFVEKGNDIRFAISTDSKRINQKVMSGKVRSAEFVLMLAESYAHLGNDAEALNYLNLLRQNRLINYSAWTIANLPSIKPGELIQMDANGNPLTKLTHAILNERRIEFFGEGDRFFELKRNGRPTFWVANNGMKYTTQQFMYTFPLPRIDIELTPGLIQNKGYEF